MAEVLPRNRYCYHPYALVTLYKCFRFQMCIRDRNSTVGAVDDNLANYRIPEAAKALQEFVDDLSNWYVRRSRERLSLIHIWTLIISLIGDMQLPYVL